LEPGLKTYITGMTFTTNGIAVRVRFSIARAGRNIVWEYSKRLKTGSIVALTPSADNFQTKCVIAIVAARPLDSVKSHPPEIDLFFAHPEDADLDTQLEWTMIEAKSGYYESARHTLTALQKMSKERFVFCLRFPPRTVRLTSFLQFPVIRVHMRSKICH
jgi:helicase required for RNAi-mediated heterochromatin assembly 1